MVEFLIGSAKSGKTQRCYEDIKEALKEEAYDNLIMLVPEQFNLQVQLELAHLLHPGLVRVEVMSFTNLAQKVLGEVGGNKEPIIDDLERVMILKKLLEEHKIKLAYFKKSYNSEGFIDGINRLITVFEQNNIQGDVLETLTQTKDASSVFKCKMEDIAHIQEWFNGYIHNKFMTVEKTMERLAGCVNKSSYLNKATLWIDGFYGFTMPQIKILTELIHKTERVVITLPMDKAYDVKEFILPNNPFYDSIRNYQRLVEMCMQEDVQYSVTQLKQAVKEECTPIHYLEQNYLKSYAKPYEGEQNQVFVQLTSNKAEEIEQVAKQIKGLIRDEQYRYRDIAVLVGDLGIYKSNLVSLFKEYGIPVFIDDKKSIHTNSLVAVIQGVLDVIIQNYTYKSIMSLLRINMMGLTLEEIDCVENYILEQGIKGEKKWAEPWERECSWITLEEINSLREKIYGKIAALKQHMQQEKEEKGRLSIKAATIGVYNFLESIEAYETIEKRIAYYKENGEGALERENAQIWGRVVETLERLVDLLGDEKVSLTTYKNILKTSFGYIKMGIIPPSKDQVIVGTIDRTRLPQTKAVFVMGVNEGLIPKVDESMNLFSDMDKLTLASLCQSKDERQERLGDVLVNQPVFSGQFLVYSALTRATEKLFISCMQADENGKSQRPSLVFYKLRKMFGLWKEVSHEPLEQIQGAMPTLGYVGNVLREYLETEDEKFQDDIWKDTLSWYMEDPVWRGRIQTLVKDFGYTNQQHYLKKENAKLLYPDGLETNISQLETYRNCPCCYFIKYGIKASERKVLKWNAADIGTLFHATLERYPKELQMRKTTWVEANEVQMNESIEAAVAHSVQKSTYANKQDGKLKYTISRVEKMSKRAINALTYQLKQGEFEPYDYEVNFGYEGLPPIEIVLDDENTILLKGQIDRVDLYVKNDSERYVKILDYKSGQKAFSLLEVYHSLQLQLLLYLDAYLRMNKNNKAAGMFYFHIDTRSIKYELGMDDAQAAARQLKQFKLSGLALDDVEIIQLMEHDIKGEIVPAKVKKDGALAATSSVASEGQFDRLRVYMIECIKTLGKEMLAGKISARPYKLKEKDACTYCKYSTICQFDENMIDNDYEKLEELRDKQIWEHICPGMKGDEK